MSTARIGRRSSLPCGAGWAACVLFLCAGAFAESTDPAGVAIVGEESPAALATLTLGRSATINTPWVIDRVAVADPEVADIQILDPDLLLLLATKPGRTDVIVWGEAGQVWRLEVNVELEIEKLTEELNRLFAGADITVNRSREVYFIQGSLQQAEQVDQLRQYLDLLEVKYVDMTRVPGVQQVQIQVRIAEANRSALRQLGINAFGIDDDVFGAIRTGTSGGPLNPINIGLPEGTPVVKGLPWEFPDGVNASPLVNLLLAFPKEDLQVFIQALQEDQYLRMLAEPNLVALSGEEASFLAGGEFPVPVPQDTGGGGGGSITIEYKQYGVMLKFTPTVMGDNVIRLKVAPEVSDVSSVGAVEIAGFQIPSIQTRRASTTLELRSGQTFAMAGLLSDDNEARNSKVPVLGDLPVLGPLFRSVRYQRGESELLVLVTAELVEPLTTVNRPPVPGDLHVEPNDWELFVEGKMEGRVDEAASFPREATDLDPDVLKQLQGPGGWATYRQPE